MLQLSFFCLDSLSSTAHLDVGTLRHCIYQRPWFHKSLSFIQSLNSLIILVYARETALAPNSAIATWSWQAFSLDLLLSKPVQAVFIGMVGRFWKLKLEVRRDAVYYIDNRTHAFIISFLKGPTEIKTLPWMNSVKWNAAGKDIQYPPKVWVQSTPRAGYYMGKWAPDFASSGRNFRWKKLYLVLKKRSSLALQHIFCTDFYDCSIQSYR